MKTSKIALSIVSFVLVAIAMVVAENANAMVRLEGTFIPSQCGTQQIVRDASEPVPPVDLQQVCVGQVAGVKGDAVLFRLTDGSEKVFRVAHTANLLMALRSNDIKSNFFLVDEEGQTASMKVIRTREGHIRSASGIVSGISYFVPEMEVIFTIQ